MNGQIDYGVEMSRKHILMVFTFLVVGLVPSISWAQLPFKLNDPERYGASTCKNAVRNSVEGCNTYGMDQDDVMASLKEDQREDCRAQCDECCGSLDQYGDGVAFVYALNEFCSCADDIADLAVVSALKCVYDTIDNNPDFVSALLLYGAFDGNVFDGPDSPGLDPVRTGRSEGPKAAWLGNGTIGDVATDPRKLPPWLLRLLGVWLVVDVCRSLGDDAGDWMIKICDKDCETGYPIESDFETPEPPEGEGGAGGGDGPDDGPFNDDGPGGPGGEGPCARSAGTTCLRDGVAGTLQEDCSCDVEQEVSVDDGCGEGTSWNSPIEECEGNSECRICDYDQDPPPWCDYRCWGYGPP